MSRIVVAGSRVAELRCLLAGSDEQDPAILDVGRHHPPVWQHESIVRSVEKAWTTAGAIWRPVVPTHPTSLHVDDLNCVFELFVGRHLLAVRREEGVIVLIEWDRTAVARRRELPHNVAPGVEFDHARVAAV